METINERGVQMISFVQHQFRNMSNVNDIITLPQYVSDPDTLVSNVFPLLVAISPWVAWRYVLAIGLVDLANNIIKWILLDDRPYWWVHESKLVSRLPTLQQYSLTCETGPGCPSGHAMTTAAAGFIIISSLSCACAKRLQSSLKTSHTVRGVLWAAYVAVIVAVALARILIATHFPHQVLLGAIAGCLGGWCVQRLPFERMRPLGFYGLALLGLGSAFLVYHTLGLMGVDPERTLALALKYCDHPENIKATTTPWHAVFRNSAIVFASGLVMRFCNWKDSDPEQTENSSSKARVTGATVCFLLLKLFSYVNLPAQPEGLFYLCVVIKNVSIVFTCLYVVPEIVVPFLLHALREKHANVKSE